MGNITELYVNLEPLIDSTSMGVKNYAISFINELKVRNLPLRGFVDDKFFVIDEMFCDSCLEQDIILKALNEGEVLDYNNISTEDVVAIYFSPRKTDKQFKYEVEVVHDLGILLCDDFHDRGMVKKLLPNIHKSLSQNDLILTVSESTKYQVDTYFHELKKKVVTVGCASFLTDDLDEGLGEPFRPFLLMIGTVEPRKNHQLIFELISKYPQIVQDYDFIIAGKFGWGKTIAQIAHDKGIEIGNFAGKISYLDNVTEIEKIKLIKNASATIYPSFYEGFGMPVFESIKMCTPVLCASSSSLIEASGGLGFYFDPFSAKGLFESIKKLRAMTEEEMISLESRMSNFSKQQTWSRVVDRSLKELTALVGSE